MYYLLPVFSILSWGLAPIVLKYFLPEINILVALIIILFFAGSTSLIQKNVLKNLTKKTFYIHVILISLLTTIHYFGNFYGILFGNIILTTLIIKNSPFFQNIIYGVIYKKAIPKTIYIFAILLMIGVILMIYDGSKINFSIPFILFPLLSSIAWAFLMIFLSKIEDKKEVFPLGNLFSSLYVFIAFYILGNDISLFFTISIKEYFILFVLGIIPTLIAPILWAKSIEKSGNNIIFLDYITPIITIIGSIVVFDLQLNTYNYIGIFIIMLSLLLYRFTNSKTGKSL